MRVAQRCLCIALIGVGLGACQVDPSPNLILISLDTTRADRLSAYGYSHDTTPNLRRLASEGARFERAYAPVPTTGPTHATLFTSLHPLRHGVLNNAEVLSAEHETLAELLAAQGYDTAAFVGSYILDAKFGFDQGFALYEAEFQEEGSTALARGVVGHTAKGGTDRRAERTTELAIDWLEKGRDPERPFFLFVHYFDPHFPYGAPDDFLASQRAERAASGEEPWSPASYDGELLYVDAQIGSLLDRLDALGLGEQTLVVVTADHGESLGEHGHIGHGLHLYEEAVRVPLLLRFPGRIPEALVVEAPAATVDLVPTILELLDLRSPSAEHQGESLATALRAGGALDAERPVYLQRRRFRVRKVGATPVRGEKLGVVAGRWKYIEAPDEDSRELYDLQADPAEGENLVDARPEKAAELSRLLSSWRGEQVGTPRAATEISDDDRERLRALGYAD